MYYVPHLTEAVTRAKLAYLSRSPELTGSDLTLTNSHLTLTNSNLTLTTCNSQLTLTN